MSSATPDTRRAGESTREALVLAALDVFGRNGFDGASTRAIADAAGVNLALIGYHFGGKSGLYLAVFEHIAGVLEQRIGPIVTAIETELLAGPSATSVRTTEQCLEALHRLTGGFAAILTSDASAAWASLILREQQSPSEGFDMLYMRFMRRMLGVIRSLVGRIRGADPDSVETRLTAVTIVGQVLVFRAARAAVMRQMDWHTVGPNELAEIQRIVRNNVTQILTQQVSQ